MKRITAVEFVNYKAFYESGEENKVVIPQGKSVLFYGENGSGKSSIYEGLKQFFSSSDASSNTVPSRHIKVSKTRIENEGQPNQAEVLNEVAVKVTFSDGTTDETKTFGIPSSNTTGTTYISRANLLNTFFSYRELLRTYLMDNPRDREEFRLKFAQLLIEVLLSKQRNSVTQLPFQKSWGNLFIPRVWYKEENLSRFTKGLEQQINRINLLLPSLLEIFEKGFNVSLILTRSEIVYHESKKVNRLGKYPICEIDLDVTLFGENIENDEENHLTVLNEARLSSLAISIYLASLINTPQDNFEFKILFLDDIFIGLDMSNRLPLLEILKNFKKPIIEQYVDGENPIAERIQEIDGINQTEPNPFFRDYQIFISTYDRYWFSVAKNWLESKSAGKWHYFEMFANKKDGLSFNTPLVYTSLNYLQKANYHYSKHDYPSCANHLRKALEERLKLLLPANEHYTEYPDNETGVAELKKIKTLNQYLEKFISYCEKNGIDASELVELKNLKDWYFNPFSHDNIGTPIFKRELDLAKALVEKIDKFQFAILLEAGTRLYFNFDNGAGQTRNYKIELHENLRWIKSHQGNILTNPIIKCYEWTKNTVTEHPNWGDDRLFHFYNNKWRGLLKQEGIPDFPMEAFWSEIYQVSNNEPLANILTLL
ncbi:MAG: AAA family ATPase [Bacteroidetes bacterium]|nr:AAA family ATPase [Bacteroidota bacterium]